MIRSNISSYFTISNKEEIENEIEEIYINYINY